MANGKRLIDANALLYEYCQANGCNEVIDEVCPNCFTAGLIADAPTVDAVEVVHGRWIETLVPDGYVQKASRLRKQCSVCGWTNACRYNYCPNCGAKMDGERRVNEHDSL